jgi:hypothetical protein
VLLRRGRIGGTAGKEPNGGLIQFALVLLQADDDIPPDLIGQLSTGAWAYSASSSRMSKKRLP